MAELPTVGGDFNTWGTILNDFLSVSINEDGTLSEEAVQAALGESGVVPGTYGSATTVPQVTLDEAGLVTEATPVTITPSGIGAAAKANNLSDLASLPTALTNLADSAGAATTLGGVLSGTFVDTGGDVSAAGVLTDLRGVPFVSTPVAAAGDFLKVVSGSWTPSLLKESDFYIPGIVTDGGVTDNTATIENYLALLTKGGQNNLVLPPGTGSTGIGVANLTVPAYCTLKGSGCTQTPGGYNWGGTDLCALQSATTATTAVVSLSNAQSRLQDLVISGTNSVNGAQTNNALLVSGEQCTWFNIGIFGGANSALRNSGTALQCVGDHFWTVGISTNTEYSVNVTGSDWQMSNANFGGAVAKVGGADMTWDNCHFYQAPSDGVDGAILQDLGGNKFIGCTFDTVIPGGSPTALIDRSGATKISSFIGCYYLQNPGSTISGFPVFLETTTAGAGAVISGGWLDIIGSSSFTNFISGAIASTLCSGISVTASGSLTAAFSPSGLGLIFGNLVGGVAAPSTAPGSVLGYTQYAPGSKTTVTVTGTGLACFAASTLKVSFVAPNSGNVQLDLSGVVDVGTSSTEGFWGVSESSGTIATVGSLHYISGSTNPAPVNTSQEITGLTPGSSYTFYLIGANSTSGDTTNIICEGFTASAVTNGGPMTMKVTAL